MYNSRMEKDLVDAIPVPEDGVKQLVPYAAALPITAVGEAFLGPAIAEVAGLLADITKHYRYKALEWFFPAVEKMIQDAGFVPAQVAPKLLFAIIEGTALEEDESLQAIWAALLANAAQPQTGASMNPVFPSILRNMTPTQAQILKWIYEKGNEAYFVPSDQIIDGCSSITDSG